MKNNSNNVIEENVQLTKLIRLCAWHSVFDNLMSEWLPTLTIKPNHKVVDAQRSIEAIISTKRKRY